MVGECMKNKFITTIVIAVISFFVTGLFYYFFLFEVPNHRGGVQCYQRNEMGECIRYQQTEEEILIEMQEAKKEMVQNLIYKIFVLTLFIIFTVLIIIFSKQYNKIIPILSIIALFMSYFNLFFIDIFLKILYFG